MPRKRIGAEKRKPCSISVTDGEKQKIIHKFGSLRNMIDFALEVINESNDFSKRFSHELNHLIRMFNNSKKDTISDGSDKSGDAQGSSTKTKEA